MEMNFVTIKARIKDARSEDERRQSARISVELDARVRELGDEGADAKVLNISEKGFMAETQTEFEVGSRIWLILPGRDRANAVVRWTAGDKIGAEFAEPLSIDELKS